MKKLTKEQKQELLDFIDDQEIEVSELESYRCFSHNQDFARFAESDDEDWIVTEDSKLAVFDLTGRKIADIDSYIELNELPKGVYIVGGKKYLIK